MAIYDGDRNGIIEVELATNGAYILVALVGLANLPFKCDPCVDIYRLRPTRAYKITLGQGSTTDYTEKTIPFCMPQMGLTAEEPLFSQASERVLPSKLIMSLPSMQLRTQTGSRPNPHIHPSHGMSASRSMGPLIPPIGLLNGKRCRF